MHGRRASTSAALVAAIVGLAACGGREVGLPTPAQVPQPTFAVIPADLATSRQLDALVLRDTAGLPPPAGGADPTLLPAAFAAVAALDDAPERFNDILVFSDFVNFTALDETVPGRSIGLSYRPGEALFVSDPRFEDSDDHFLLSDVDPRVPARLVTAIEGRFPSLRVTYVRLNPSLSYDFGLVWNLTLADARGDMATVFADLDGTVVGVDLS